MTTYSQLVDAIVQETKRPDLLSEACSYVNQTIREAHFDENNRVRLFRDNLREARVVANTDTGFGWDIPDPAIFMQMQAVRFDVTGWADEVTPSRGLRDRDRYYYRAGSRYTFDGYGGANSPVSLAWYEFPRRLVYRPAATRYATYDPEMGWSYPSTLTPEAQATARALCSNWLLMRWTDTILEGVRAKIYKRVSDDSRARMCYSLYQASVARLVSSESADLGGYA